MTVPAELACDASARHAKGQASGGGSQLGGDHRANLYSCEKAKPKSSPPLNPRLRARLAVGQVLELKLSALIPEDLPDRTAGR